MMHVDWSIIGEVPFNFSRVSAQSNVIEKKITNCYETMHKAWSMVGEAPLLFFEVICQISSPHETKNCWFLPQNRRDRTVTQVWIHQWLLVMHKAWNSIEEVPYCFWRSSVKFQNRTGQKIFAFGSNWAFPDWYSSLDSPMATTWYAQLDIA